MTRSATPVVARSLLATGEIVGFAAYAHAQAGGHLPAPAQLGVLTVGVLAATALLLSGKARLWTLVPLVAVLQVVLHEAFTGLSSPMPRPGAMPGMSGSGAMQAADHRMLLTHALIAVVTVLVLVSQHQALRALAEVVDVFVRVRPTVPALRRSAPAALAAVRLRTHLLGVSPRRGPPAVAS